MDKPPFGDKVTDQHDEAGVPRQHSFHLGIAASPVPIVVIDIDATVHLWNPAAEQLFGCSKEQVIAGSIPIVPFEQHDGVRASGTPGIQAIVLTPSRDPVAGEPGTGRLLQAVTDACRLLSGAQFAAACVRIADDQGESFLLYALSGPLRQVQGSFAAPRQTIGFAPMSRSNAMARSGGVTQDHWDDGSPAHAGASPEELPVGSYLAVPMIGHSGAVCGGLFLSHLDADMFTKESERVVGALVAYTGSAIDTARLDEVDRRPPAADEAAGRAKDAFLAVLGHELRNPLAAVRNGIATARLDPARGDRALELADHGVEQLSRLTDDLLDVARITHGKIMLRRAAVSLAQVVERAIESARQHIEAREHTIAVSLPEGNFRVNGDALRLEQVIGNLLSNASKYMNRGGHITVALTHEDAEVVLRVRDTGIGIAPEVLPRVFDLFAQAEQSVDSVAEGLGIGLALVKRIVELHGGRVEAHSLGCGTGAEFVVRLPAVAASPQTATPQVRMKLADDRARAHVLVVDDQAEVVELTTMLLETRGHRVRTALDGPSALRAALADPPDVMLVDIGLPGMDGYQVAQSVRQQQGLRQVRLVALTGRGRKEDRRKALAAGFDYHLSKPVNIEAFFKLVARLAAPKPSKLPAIDRTNSVLTETTAARAAFRVVGATRRVHVPQGNDETA